MFGCGESDYVKELRRKELEKIECEERLRDFRQKYKQGIERGDLKASDFTPDNLPLFRQIKEECEWEERQGAAFLEGFTNPNFMEKVRNGNV